MKNKCHIKQWKDFATMPLWFKNLKIKEGMLRF